MSQPVIDPISQSNKKFLHSKISIFWLVLLPMFVIGTIIGLMDILVIFIQIFIELGSFDLANGSPESLSLLLLFNAVIDIIALGILYFSIQKKWIPFNKQEKNYHGIFLSFQIYAMAFTIIFVLGLITDWLWTNFFPNSSNQSPYDSFLLNDSNYSLINPYLIIVTIVIIGPIFEEFLFRRLLIPLIEGTGIFSTSMAIIISSTMFGLLHSEADLVAGSVRFASTHFVTSTIIGIGLGIIYVLTRDIRFPILIHILNNGFAILGQFLFYFEPIPETVDIEYSPGPMTLLFVALFFAFILVGAFFIGLTVFQRNKFWMQIRDQFNPKMKFSFIKKAYFVLLILLVQGLLFVVFPIIDLIIERTYFTNNDWGRIIVGFIFSIVIFLLSLIVILKFKDNLKDIGRSVNPLIKRPPQKYYNYPQVYNQNFGSNQESPDFYQPNFVTRSLPSSKVTPKRFCGNCGSDLPVVNSNIPKYCPNCGKSLNIDDYLID